MLVGKPRFGGAYELHAPPYLDPIKHICVPVTIPEYQAIFLLSTRDGDEPYNAIRALLGLPKWCAADAHLALENALLTSADKRFLELTALLARITGVGLTEEEEKLLEKAGKKKRRSGQRRLPDE